MTTDLTAEDRNGTAKMADFAASSRFFASCCKQSLKPTPVTTFGS